MGKKCENFYQKRTKNMKIFTKNGQKIRKILPKTDKKYENFLNS